MRQIRERNAAAALQRAAESTESTESAGSAEAAPPARTELLRLVARPPAAPEPEAPAALPAVALPAAVPADPLTENTRLFIAHLEQRDERLFGLMERIVTGARPTRGPDVETAVGRLAQDLESVTAALTGLIEVVAKLQKA